MFVSCQYDVFYVFCMFYWQIRQFALGSIQFQEELHLRKRKKNTFQCSDQFSYLQLVYFQRYTRLYPVNMMFFCVFCMFYWQILQFSLGSIQFQEELHLSKRKKNTFPV